MRGLLKISHNIWWLCFSLYVLLVMSDLHANNEMHQKIKKVGPHGGRVQEFGPAYDIECYRSGSQIHFFVLKKDSKIGDSINSHRGGTLTVKIQGNDIPEVKSVPKKIPFQEISMDLSGDLPGGAVRTRGIQQEESDIPTPPLPRRVVKNGDIDKKNPDSKKNSNNIEANLRLSVPSIANHAKIEYENLSAVCEF